MSALAQRHRAIAELAFRRAKLNLIKGSGGKIIPPAANCAERRWIRDVAVIKPRMAFFPFSLAVQSFSICFNIKNSGAFSKYLSQQNIY